MMPWYRRSSRFIFDAFRRYNSKTTTTTTTTSVVPACSKQRSSYSRISKDFQIRIRSNYSRISEDYSRISEDFQIRVKRFYMRKEVQHLKTIVSTWSSENHEKISISIFLIGSGFVITLCYGNKETVPYTKRSRFVLMSPSYEKKLGESAFKDIKSKHKGKILPPSDPVATRVTKIAQDIIETVKSHGTAMEGLKWEVIVVDEPKTVNAFCVPGGKIVVFTGLLTHFIEDAEIATIIAHEVGHAVARHTAEKIHKLLWRFIVRLIFYQFFEGHVVVDLTSALCLKLPHSRRMEMEADYIGLVLMAFAGYDPQAAPKVYEKLGKIGGSSSTLANYVSTHPSGNKRSKRLSQPKVMEEALSIYTEAQAV